MGNTAKAEANRIIQGFAFLESSQDGKTVSGDASAAKAILTSCPGSYSEFLLEGRTEIHDRAVSGKF